MLIYEAPDSPESWLGREDLWLIGELAEYPIPRKLTGSLFNCLLYPMFKTGGTERLVRPADIGLVVCSRVDVGMPKGVGLVGNASQYSGAFAAHKVQSEHLVDARIALIQAAGVLAVTRNAELMSDLCHSQAYTQVPEIAPAFAESLSRLIFPETIERS